MYPRNAASPPPIAVGAVVQISDGAVQTSAASARVKTGSGSWGASAGTLACDTTSGIWTYIPTQGETNAESFIVAVYKASCLPCQVTVVTSKSDTAGYAGLDWGQVANKTTTNALTGTTIATSQAVASVSGSVGSVATGGISAASFAAGAIDAAAIANGAIDAATFAADVDAEFLSYIVDDATRIDASALNTLSSHDPGEAIMGATDLGTGSGFTAIPWNASWDTEVQSEVQDAIEANNLDHLVKVAVDTNFATTVHLDSVIGQLADNGTTATFDRTTDSLEAIQGYTAPASTALSTATWTGTLATNLGTTNSTVATNLDTTVSSRSSHSAADVVTAMGTGTFLTAIPWNAAWDAEVQSEVQDAIEVNHLDHLLAATYDPASKPGAADALLNEIIGNDAGVSQFTANALELAPTGGSAPTASQIADEVQTRTIAAVTTVNGLGAGVITATSIASDAITAAKIANGAIDAATFAADVDAEILSYLVDDATRIDASALNTATGTTIPAILADTNELQTDWANGGRLDLILDDTLTVGTQNKYATVAAAGNIVTGTSATQFTTDISFTTDAFVDALIGFSSGALAGQYRPILSMNSGTGVITVSESFTGTPQAGDDVWIKIAHVHPISQIQSGLATQASVDVIDGIVDAILVDTGTTLQAELDGIQADTEDIQARLPAALVAGRIDASVGAMAVNTLTASALASDAVSEIQSGLSTLTQTQVTGGAYALNSASFAFNSAMDFTTAQKAATLARVTLTDTVTTYTGNTPQTGDSYAIVNSGTYGNAAIKGYVDDIGVAGVGLTAIPWNASWDAEVQSEVQDAIEANHLDHLLAADYDPANKPGVATALLNEIIGNDAGVSQFTANAMELAPTGGASAAAIADAVWDEAIAGHSTSGSAGASLIAAGSAGDPWATPQPGAYAAGTFGYLISTTTPALLQAALTAASAVIPESAGTIEGFPDTLTIGDSYVTALNNFIKVYVRDSSATPLTGIGTKNFSDADFEAVLTVSQGSRTSLVTATCTWVPAAGPVEGYVKVEFTTDQTRRATEGSATMQLVFKWDGGIETTIATQPVEWEQRVTRSLR